jgi:ADP-ribosylglycohydrolase
MRVAPIALGLPDELVYEHAVSTSALTHGHPVGQLAAAAWAMLIARVAAGHALGAAATQIAAQMISSSTEAAEVGRSMRAALDAKPDGSPATVETLGGGWTAEEALAIALYACLCAADFEHGLRVAVTHSGDSDSTGAIAGNMLGLQFPDQVFSHPWAAQVGGRDMIAKLAVDLPLAQYWTPAVAADRLLRHLEASSLIAPR